MDIKSKKRKPVFFDYSRKLTLFKAIQSLPLSNILGCLSIMRPFDPKITTPGFIALMIFDTIIFAMTIYRGFRVGMYNSGQCLIKAFLIFCLCCV